MDKLYTIQQVAAKLNLSDKTLRRWEEAGRFKPSRTLGNQRRYCLEDLQILDAIKHGTISSQTDLLSVEQAANMCGVSPATLSRWEDAGKIHPFITSGNTYYLRQKLVDKLDELKKISVEPIPAPQGSDLSQGTVPQRNPRLQVEEGSAAAEETVPKGVSKLPPLISNLAPTPHPVDIQYFIFNLAITLVILLGYHLLFNFTARKPLSPTPEQVSVAATTLRDPRVDDLITKFQNHLDAEMLKDSAPAPTETLKIDNASLISGSSSLPKGKDQVSVQNPAITPTSLVTANFTSDYSPAKKYWLTQTEGSFTLHTDFPVSENSPFNYLILAATASAKLL